MKRRRLLALVTFTTPLMVAAAACSFPNLTFGPEIGDGAGPDTGLGETNGSADSGSDDVTVDTSADTGMESGIDAADASDATDASDAGDASDDADVDAGPLRCPTDSTKPKCDCDDDGYGDVNCDVDPTTITGTSGNPLIPGDCDDADNQRHPGQGFVSVEPDAGKDGNWDCVLPIEVLHPPISCSGTGLLGCQGTPSFLGVTGCGLKADLYDCEGVPENGLATCIPTVAGGQITQGCK